MMFPIFRFIGPMKVPCIISKLFENNLSNIVIKYLNMFLRVVSYVNKCSTSYLIVYDTSQYYYFDISRRHWCKMARSLGSPFFWRLFSDLILHVRFNTINHFVHKHTFLPLLINSPTKLCVSFCLHSEFRWTSWKISLCIQE